MKSLARLIALFAAVQLLGGHWVVLQSAAWVGMVVAYSQHESIGTALEKTFDGAHPCSVCVMVKHGQSEEKKQSSTKIMVKVEAVLVALSPLPERVFSAYRYPEVREHSVLRYLAPPVPPPLAA